jgi:hypothetical protein
MLVSETSPRVVCSEDLQRDPWDTHFLAMPYRERVALCIWWGMWLGKRVLGNIIQSPESRVQTAQLIQRYLFFVSIVSCLFDEKEWWMLE